VFHTELISSHRLSSHSRFNAFVIQTKLNLGNNYLCWGLIQTQHNLGLEYCGIGVVLVEVLAVREPVQIAFLGLR
jgi:hypothetical protein